MIYGVSMKLPAFKNVIIDACIYSTSQSLFLANSDVVDGH